jgi:phage tail sheath protein FI
MATTYYTPGVYVEEQPAGSRPIQGVGTAVAGFVGRTASVPGDLEGPALVTNWTQFKTQFGDLGEGLPLPFAVQGFFQNGGGSAFIAPVGVGAAPRPTIDVPGAGEGTGPVLRATAREESAAGPAIVLEVSDPAGEEADAETTFNLVVRAGGQEERYDGLAGKRGAQGAAATVTSQSKLVELADAGRGGGRPANGRYELVPPGPKPVDASAFLGDDVARTGLAGLGAIDDVTMLVAPDITAAPEGGDPDADLITTVQGAMVDQATTLHDRMAILDAPPGMTAQQVLDWKSAQPGLDSPFAVLYYPWIGVYNPGGTRPLLMPPSGHMAGVWSRSDNARGVHKAPANEPISGCQSLAVQITHAEQALLNPDGINVIRSFPGRGIRVWGARTATTSDRDWQYVNVRRLFNYVEESIQEGTQWVVFEPNSPDLWQRIVRTVSAFLTVTWRSGALFGRKPEEAFYVKCDEETNPPDVIDAGQVVIEVGMAAVRPAEFVVFRIAQLASGAQSE